METETNTAPAVRLVDNPVTGCYVIVKPGQRLTLTQDELQAVAQAAYDQFGILAAPSLEVEAAAGEALPTAAPGACPCGADNCSDRMAYYGVTR